MKSNYWNIQQNVKKLSIDYKLFAESDHESNFYEIFNNQNESCLMSVNFFFFNLINWTMNEICQNEISNSLNSFYKTYQGKNVITTKKIAKLSKVHISPCP